MSRKNITAITAALKIFRETRERIKEEDAEVKEQQPELVEALEDLGVTNDIGLVFDPTDASKGAGYVQRNQGSVLWDEDKVIKYLRKKVAGRKALWLACSTRVLDMRKWEAEVAAGNIPKGLAKKMQYTTDPANPFIRFGKITKECIK